MIYDKNLITKKRNYEGIFSIGESKIQKNGKTGDDVAAIKCIVMQFFFFWLKFLTKAPMKHAPKMIFMILCRHGNHKRSFCDFFSKRAATFPSGPEFEFVVSYHISFNRIYVLYPTLEQYLKQIQLAKYQCHDVVKVHPKSVQGCQKQQEWDSIFSKCGAIWIYIDIYFILYSSIFLKLQ